MPKVASDVPDNLRAFIYHGLDLSYGEKDTQAIGACPECGKESKFSINIETSKYQCFSCGIRGNNYDFLNRLWELSYESSPNLSNLAVERGLLLAESIDEWGICQSHLTGEIIIPGYNSKGGLSQLYKYVEIEGKYRVILTPKLKHRLIHSLAYNDDAETVYLCEGVWDAIALYELRDHVPDLVDAEIMAVPGANVFLEEWCPTFANKNVVILFDSDHPRTGHKGTVIPPVGHEGVKRIVKMLYAGKAEPASVLALNWGENGYDPDLPSGYDIRDCIKEGATAEERGELISELFQRIEPIAEEQVKAAKNSKKVRSADKVEELKPIHCESYATMIKSWREAMEWTEGLDCALSVMLASAISTRAVGDQLWVKIVGPPSCGKTTLCEALAVAKKYVFSNSTTRGFHSGFKSDGDGSEDNSMISKINDKTLITKDGDTLLQSQDLGRILSEARDIYDGATRAHYRNRITREYSGLRMTWILCGTSSLRKLDSSELGERFLDCVIMSKIDDELEDEILVRKAKSAEKAVGLESGVDAETQESPEYVLAKRLTGGYVYYLRDNAQQLLSNVRMSDSVMHRIIRLGKFVAFMRARPSKIQGEDSEREIAARLVSQHIRLAKCLAAVMNRQTVDAEVLRRTTKVAFDTSRGITFDLLRIMENKDNYGLTLNGACTAVGQSEYMVRQLLRFLRKIGAIESYVPVTRAGTKQHLHYRMTPMMRKLYQDVHRSGLV